MKNKIRDYVTAKERLKFKRKALFRLFRNRLLSKRLKVLSRSLVCVRMIMPSIKYSCVIQSKYLKLAFVFKDMVN
ncbi:TPA: hypothetical protein ACW6D3_003200 [Legionella pneumophila]